MRLLTGGRGVSPVAVSGLELGLRHMRKGEKGLIRATAKYAFGPFGRKNVGYAGEVEVPPDADIEYEVEVGQTPRQL